MRVHPPLYSNLLTLLMLFSCLFSCALLVCTQAQKWSEEDLADAELLKAAWPRMR